MPRRIAVFVADFVRHGVMNITVSRLSSLVSSCLHSGLLLLDYEQWWWDSHRAVLDSVCIYGCAILKPRALRIEVLE